MLSADIAGHFSIDTIDNDFGPYLFLRNHESRGNRHIVRTQFQRAVPVSVLPDRAVVVQTIQDGECYDVLAEVDGVLVLLRAWKTAADVWASGDDDSLATAILSEIRGRAPEEFNELRVGVRFTDCETGDRYLKLEVRPWAQARRLYAPPVVQALDDVMGHRPADAQAARLLLWHGAPGTGKTTAIRALLHAWRGWADGAVVTDPELLLADGRYLRRAVLRNLDDDRWQLIVLEDAESLLQKGSGSKGLAKLLNLADGLLGQGLRCLFLITTNEPIASMHPALLRPGRCLANIEFTTLPAAKAAELLGRPVARDMTLAELCATAPVTVSGSTEIAVGQYL